MQGLLTREQIDIATLIVIIKYVQKHLDKYEQMFMYTNVSVV
jgi:hypothetical protein